VAQGHEDHHTHHYGSHTGEVRYAAEARSLRQEQDAADLSCLALTVLLLRGREERKRGALALEKVLLTPALRACAVCYTNTPQTAPCQVNFVAESPWKAPGIHAKVLNYRQLLMTLRQGRPPESNP
jgi:hypothetical protein